MMLRPTDASFFVPVRMIRTVWLVSESPLTS